MDERFWFRMFSAALRCGLIEARGVIRNSYPTPCFPQHYAAASLKRHAVAGRAASGRRFPQHYAAASLKRDCHRENIG